MNLLSNHTSVYIISQLAVFDERRLVNMWNLPCTTPCIFPISLRLNLANLPSQPYPNLVDIDATSGLRAELSAVIRVCC